jgi:hypothetical protein
MFHPEPTLAFSSPDLKHLFDASEKCRTRPVKQVVRATVRSNVHMIERVYDRTVIRSSKEGRDERHASRGSTPANLG